MEKNKEKIYRAYTAWVAENKKKPEFIEAFIIEADVSLEVFTSYFKTFIDLEKSFWADLFMDAVTQTSRQNEFDQYSVNEKLLGFYFTWVELIKEYREFIIYTFHNVRFHEIYPSEFDYLKKYFEEVIGQLIVEGMNSGEIAVRPWITDKYKYLLWSQPIMIIRFWSKDTSENFESTDALIEKTVNFSFDLMRSNSLDSFIDLAKFHIQHR